jgi:hypothetical protein
MKILLSVLACAPNTGRETGDGWIYAIEPAKLQQVWVLTDGSRRNSIETYDGLLPANLRISFYRPKLMCALKR